MATATLPPPPAGYTLDSPAPQQAASASPNLPPPPAGYTLDQPEPEDFGRKLERFDQDLLPGVFKGAASTLFHAADLIRSGETALKNKLPQPVQDWMDSAPQSVKDFIGYGNRPLDNPSVQQATTPNSAGEKTGFGAEQLAEYAVPGMEAQKGASLATKAILSGGKAALVRGAQTGGDLGQMAAVGATGAALPVAGAAAKAVGGALARGAQIPQAAIDVTGIADPRVAFGLRMLNKISSGIAKLRGISDESVGSLSPEGIKAWNDYAASVPKATAEATGENALVQPASGYGSPERPGWRSDIVNDLNQPKAASAQPQTTQTSPAPQPDAAPQSNQFEAKARTEKARALADFLYQGGHGIPIDDARIMNPDHWKMAAQGAGVNNPSPATTKQAIQQLQKLWDAHAAAQQLSDSMTPPGAPLQ